MRKSGLLLLAATAVALLTAAGPAVSQVRYDLPAQGLEESLRAIGKASDLNILIDRKLVAGLQAPALRGELSATDAIGQLLQGSGLTFEIVADKTIVLTRVGAGGVKPVADADPVGPALQLAQADTAQSENPNNVWA